MSTSIRFFRFASPAAFYPLAGKLVPWFTAVAGVLAAIGLYLGMLRAPTDATQGDAYRIIFIHVPAAWMSMLLYVAMAFWAAIGWAFNARLASIVARAIAPTGALFTFLALWTGALWGKPTWGAWWVWDARLTSELILLFLYVGYLALVSAIDDTRRADRAGALLAVVGSVNVPIIYFSVIWWNTLHQGASISVTSAPKMASVMLLSMLLMTLSFWAYAFAVIFVRARAIAPRTRQSRRLGERRGARAAGPTKDDDVNWSSASEFFAMGGYGLYVWGAYVVTAACMAIEPVTVALRHRRARAGVVASGGRR